MPGRREVSLFMVGCAMMALTSTNQQARLGGGLTPGESKD